jgi:hypothetical protein
MLGSLLWAASAVHAEDEVLQGPELQIPEAPSSDDLMRQVRALLPRDPIAIEGILRTRKRKGLDSQTLGIAMNLHWGAKTPTASYSIQDKHGKAIETMTIMRDDEGRVELDYAAGDPLKKEPAPPVTRTIQKTNISWADLSLAFLWWRGGVIEGRETIKGQECLVANLPAPENENGQYHFVKLWIDSKYHVLIKAEGYDQEGVIVREMLVRSFKKINDHWMIKDLDVRSIPSEHKTTLRIEEVEEILPE